MNKKQHTNYCSQSKKYLAKNPPKIKRYFLPTLAFMGVLVIRDVYDYVYLPFIFFYTGLVLFWNFPFLMYITNSKPLFYDDLFLDPEKVKNLELPEHFRKRFKKVIDCWMIFANAFLLGAMSDFWLYKTDFSMNTMELIGVTGGLFKILQDANNIVVSIALDIIRRIMLHEHKKTRELLKYPIQTKYKFHIHDSQEDENTIIRMESIDESHTKLLQSGHPMSFSQEIQHQKLRSPNGSTPIKKYNSD